MRRVLRAVFEHQAPGDLSALANPEASTGCANNSAPRSAIFAPLSFGMRRFAPARKRSITTIGNMDSGSRWRARNDSVFSNRAIRRKHRLAFLEMRGEAFAGLGRR